MRSIKRHWLEDEDLFGFKEKRGKFSRTRALKVKRELRKLAYF
jgi:hypothetical protein